MGPQAMGPELGNTLSNIVKWLNIAVLWHHTLCPHRVSCPASAWKRDFCVIAAQLNVHNATRALQP